MAHPHVYYCFLLFFSLLFRVCTAITWLGFRDCVFGGDEGLRIMTHYIGKLNLQVLAIEQCQLTDASTVYIASILKAQQNNLDSLYWNATLRVDPGLRGALWNASEIDEVYRCGLVALSLYGNQFEGKDIYALTRVLRNNHWLLGMCCKVYCCCFPFVSTVLVFIPVYCFVH